MPKSIHKANTRGFFDYDWLKTFHTFSFSYYYDPGRMNFGKLRVINDDYVDPKTGFDLHPHNNMEIISIPLTGEMRHEDSQGNVQIIKPGGVQIMSAGSGIFHAEYNNSETETANFIQIWIHPKVLNISPRYDVKEFPPEGRNNDFQLIISPETSSNTLKINQDAFLSLSDLQSHKSLYYKRHLESNGVYFFIFEGDVHINDDNLLRRDGIGLTEISEIIIEANADSRLLAIEVPMLAQESSRR